MIKGILLERSELANISLNLRVTKHALERLKEFYKDNITIKEIKFLISKSPLAWKQDNGQYAICLDEYSYFVLYKYLNKFILVSYMRKSENGYNIIDKFILEYKGVKKKWLKGQSTRTKLDC